MAGYEVVLKRSAEKELRALPDLDLRRIVKRIQTLADDPRPPGCEKLAGGERFHVRQGDYRIVYQVDDAAHRVDVVKIGHRREICR